MFELYNVGQYEQKKMGTRDVMNTASESSMQKCCFKVTSLPTPTQFSNYKKSFLGISFVNFKSKS